jgi:hypothetical protein
MFRAAVEFVDALLVWLAAPIPDEASLMHPLYELFSASPYAIRDLEKFN